MRKKASEKTSRINKKKTLTPLWYPQFYNWVFIFAARNEYSLKIASPTLYFFLSIHHNLSTFGLNQSRELFLKWCEKPIPDQLLSIAKLPTTLIITDMIWIFEIGWFIIYIKLDIYISLQGMQGHKLTIDTQ